jgi:hypothetical protein
MVGHFEIRVAQLRAASGQLRTPSLPDIHFYSDRWPMKLATSMFSHVIWRTPAFMPSCFRLQVRIDDLESLFSDLKIDDKRFVQNI